MIEENGWQRAVAERTRRGISPSQQPKRYQNQEGYLHEQAWAASQPGVKLLRWPEPAPAALLHALPAPG